MIRPALCLAALALVLTGCPEKEGARAAPQAAATAASAASAAPSAPGALVPSRATGEVTRGQPAPDFDVTASDGTRLKLADLRGRPVVLYFYPKDETPGCTKEACAFRDAWSAFDSAKVVLVGVSSDDDAAHKAFAAHHKLPFHLVSDPERALAQRYGVPPFGRQSFLIGPDGTLKKIYRTVDVTVHAKELLSDLGG